uniref:EF-hand domain-containing protein n=1 Tax=Noctiluca scintillans TaxID=2966 RepID=A0A7S1AZ76_NOCSC|mmetsp:Transcript_66148/g.175309  ORF Transcript_66148/g.175309 Transcript_66148/m.175309 type:complete len:190 (+) Transcript_66148:2-571(+)|eukprot:CAMPEP_0194494792 /NCGR_PEP_ID=MMETSP0253-20130528/12588_1 /TAXON_ID=2966 /ORGANISM="Noctiluca scintillans" /LENGTH=189 /DNA_ID=CAMNT_0039335957 /DNA_START=1 /DNA_END=570 /DNA_ORIENTATION=+
MGLGSSSSLMHHGSPLEDEEEAIGMVFDIIDSDHSGAIDMEELKKMFQIYDEGNSHLVESVVKRILHNVDKDGDNSVTKEEFQKMLTLKFSHKDSRADIEAAFREMIKKGNDHQEHPDIVTSRGLLKLSNDLKQGLTKEDTDKMVMMFSQKYQDAVAQQKRDDPTSKKEIPVPAGLTVEEFYNVMQMES